MAKDTLQKMIKDFSSDGYIKSSKPKRKRACFAEGSNRVLEYLGIEELAQNVDDGQEGSSLFDVHMTVILTLLQRIEKLEEQLAKGE